MTESIVLFAQSIVVLVFVYLTAILMGAVIHFISSRKEGYWTVAIREDQVETAHVWNEVIS